MAEKTKEKHDINTKIRLKQAAYLKKRNTGNENLRMRADNPIAIFKLIDNQFEMTYV